MRVYLEDQNQCKNQDDDAVSNSGAADAIIIPDSCLRVLESHSNKTLAEKCEQINELLRDRSEWLIDWSDIKRKKVQPDEFGNWDWVSFEDPIVDSETEKSIIDLLFVLSQMNRLYGLNKSIYLEGKYYNLNRYLYIDAATGSKEHRYDPDNHKNSWSLKYSCIHTIYAMSSADRKSIFQALYEKIDEVFKEEPPQQEKLIAFPYFVVSKDQLEFNVPITDHPLVSSAIMLNGQVYSIGTLNMWCPGTPISPSVSDALNLGICFRLPQEYHQKQMEEMAKYIVSIFEQGINLLVLQEVPDVKSDAFKILLGNIKNHALKKLISLDVALLKAAFRQTGGHHFGTSILVDSSKFRLDAGKIKSVLGGRGAEYTVTELSSNQCFNLMNFHAEYQNEQQYSAIMEAVGSGKVCLGDSNFDRAFAYSASMNQVASLQVFSAYKVRSRKVQMNTSDVIFVPNQIKHFDHVLQQASLAAVAASVAVPVQAPALIAVPVFKLKNGSFDIASLVKKTDEQLGEDYYFVQYVKKNSNEIIGGARIYKNGVLKNGAGNQLLGDGSPLRFELEAILTHFGVFDRVSYLSNPHLDSLIRSVKAYKEEKAKLPTDVKYQGVEKLLTALLSYQQNGDCDKLIDALDKDNVKKQFSGVFSAAFFRSSALEGLYDKALKMALEARQNLPQNQPKPMGAVAS